MDSRTYWNRRERDALMHYVRDEKEYERRVQAIYKDMLYNCQKEIDSFYGKYAAQEGITIAEAKKRVSKAEISAYESKAKKYVANKTFTKKANEEMRLYNTTMKINRLEMLKANIGLELLAGHSELEGFMGEILKGRTMEELERQAGILGKTIKNNAELAHSIVNASFHNATFSDRIWMYQDQMKNDLSSLLQSGLIQGKGSRQLARELRKYWYGDKPNAQGGAVYCMERLMRTELARVQTDAQKRSFERNNYDKYIFIVNGGCCPICEATAKQNTGHSEKGVFNVKDMMPGTNAPPMHPQCRCSTAAWVDEKEFEAWLDFLDEGGTSEEWAKKKQSPKKKQRLNEGMFTTWNATKGDTIRPKSIMKSLRKTDIGREMLEYINSEQVPVKLCYGVDNLDGRVGMYDPFDDEITIFCDISKTVEETAATVIHEATHRKMGCKGTFEEEVECFKNELIHRKGKLTDSDINDIIDHVKKYYPELK